MNTHSALWKQDRQREQVHTRAGTPAGATHVMTLPGTFKKENKSLRWIQHDTLVMQQAASSEVMLREHSSSEKHKELQRSVLFSKVVKNGTFGQVIVEYLKGYFIQVLCNNISKYK